MGSITDGQEVCCPLPGQPISGREFTAAIGTQKDAQGNVDYSSGKNEKTNTITFEQARRIVVRPGQELRFSTILDFGLQKQEGLAMTIGSGLPVGWKLELERKEGVEDVTGLFDLAYKIIPRGGAGTGESGVIEFRVNVAGRNSPIDETRIEFVVDATDLDMKQLPQTCLDDQLVAPASGCC